MAMLSPYNVFTSNPSSIAELSLCSNTMSTWSSMVESTPFQSELLLMSHY